VACAVACDEEPEEVTEFPGQVMQVTTDTSTIHHYDPEISADGTRIIFSTNWWGQDPPLGQGKGEEARDVAIIEVPTTEIYPPTPNLETIGNTRRIDFVNVPADDGSIIDPNQVSVNSKGMPVWNPTIPTQIAFMLRNNNALDRVYLADLDYDPDPNLSNEPIAGVNVRLVGNPGGQLYYFRSPAFSADGQWLAVSRYYFSPGNPTGVPPTPDIVEPQAIYAYRIADGLLVKLTAGSSLEDNPTWSPSGRSVAFQSNRSGAYEIWAVDFDPTNPQAHAVDFNIRRLTDSNPERLPIPAASEDPTWSPDGSSIVFVSTLRAPGTSARHRNLWIMNADGSNLRLFYFARFDNTHPSFGPTDARLVTFSSAWNPHEDFAGAKTDIYIIKNF
jgi:Tol biopolymer transport system component